MKRTKTPDRGHALLFFLRPDEYELLQHVAERDKRFPTAWVREAVRRALKRAVRDEAAT